jgi:hypothetical protein
MRTSRNLSLLTKCLPICKKIVKRITDSGAHDPFLASRRMSLLRGRTQLTYSVEQEKKTNLPINEEKVANEERMGLPQARPTSLIDLYSGLLSGSSTQ